MKVPQHTSKYLLLSEQYVPLRGGHVVLLHETFRRLGSVCVVTGAMDGQPAFETVDGVEIRRVKLSRFRFLRPESAFLYASLLYNGAKAIAQLRPEVIVAARALPEGLVATILGRWYGLPTLVYAHGEEISPWMAGAPPVKRRRLTATVKRAALWGTYARSDVVIANSRFTEGLLVKGGVDSRKIALVHPGTDPRQYCPAPRNREMIDRLGLQGKRVLLTVGRLMPRKGHDSVLQALPEILRSVPDTVYVIAGAGEYGEHLREMTRTMGLESCVRFLGEAPTDILPDLYNLCDVFVMPNRVTSSRQDLEGFGIVFLEANACEKPVVGGRSGGVPDAVEDGRTGLLVDGASPPEIARAVTRLLLDDELARRMGAEGRQRVCSDFTWDAVSRKAHEVIEQLKNRRRDRSHDRGPLQ